MVVGFMQKKLKIYNTMTIQQQLANRLYELLPHKKELEFGCEVLITLGHYQEKCTVTSLYADGSGFLTNGNYAKVTAKDFTGHSYEIIGQPLRLADLLLAIGKVSKPLPELQLFSVHLDISKRGSNGRDNCLYNLQDDNILNQSDELCLLALDSLK